MSNDQLTHDDLLALLYKAGWDTDGNLGVTTHGTTVTFFRISSPSEQRQEVGQGIDDAIGAFLVKLDEDGDGE